MWGAAPRQRRVVRRGWGMNCRSCARPMTMVYEVVERETRFVLWECGCSHKELERKPIRAAVPAASTSAPAPASADDDD